MSSRRFVLPAVVVVFGAALAVWRGGLFAAERRPVGEGVPIEGPRDGGDAIVVAIVDTGLDAGHPGLEDMCLPGVNVAEPGEPTTDPAGHGTAVALLVRRTMEDAAYALLKERPLRFLPVKVTAGADGQALPAIVGLGVKKAVDAGAAVICVPMGGSRSTEGLDEALEAARAAGIVVVAAAGICDGSADFWPAAHPWAVSCTAWEPSLTRQPDGTDAMVERPAARAQYSGKTELLGDGYAKFKVGGTEVALQGTSAVCARAAGHAAAILACRPELGGAAARRLLTLGGPALRVANFGLTYPMRRMEPAAYAAALAAGDAPDFVVVDEMPDPAPLLPDKPGKSSITIRNIGRKPGAGEVEVEFPATKTVLKAAFKSVEPDATTVVTVDLPALAEGTHSAVVRVRAEGDPNAENDWMQVNYRPMGGEAIPVITGRASVVRLRQGDGSAVLRIEVANTTHSEATARLVVAAGDKSVEKEITVGPRARTEAELEFAVPNLTEGKTGAIIGYGLMQGDKVICQSELDLRLDGEAHVPQYADAWATKELVFDAPAFVVEGREDVPFLVFAPEVCTLLTETRIPHMKSPLGPWRVPRGLWLYDVFLEQIPAETAIGLEILPWGSPPKDHGGKALLHVQGEPTRYERRPEATRLCDPPPLVENAEGTVIPEGPDTLVQWIGDDGWHVVVNVPIRALSNPADSEVYVYCRGQVQDQATNPSSISFNGFAERRVVHQTVLRVRLHASLPSLHPQGQYYDIHVHTASEFSRDIVEPRLAFGGPLWMLLRSAYAMGFVDWNYLAAKKGHPGAGPAGEKLITTDHNVFLTDAHRPSWFPYQADGAAEEIRTIRRFVGRGANQELSLAAPGRDIGAQHALVYGLEPLPGPWHGGRSWRAKILEYKGILDLVREMKLERPAIRTLRGALRGFLESGLLRRELVARVVKKYPELKGKLTDERAEEFCQLWTEMNEKDLDAIPGQLQRILDAAVGATEENRWNVAEVEQAIFSVHGRYIAAHPFTGHGLHWNLEDLDRAANLAPGSAALLANGDEFPFKGVQAWNEPHPKQCELNDPDKLRGFNIWQSGRLKDVPDWHGEWMKGMLHYLDRMVKPGLTFTFQEGQARQKLFIRKLYHYAGSDAHGSFNFTTGVGGTILTHPGFSKLFEMLGLAHGSISHTSHYGAARVYAERPAFEEIFRGRVVCTDGPLMWPVLDADLKFDSDSLIWHESWDEWAKGDDADGRMGGDGRFDGLHTALVRRACDKMVVQYRVNEHGPRSPAIESLELYTLRASDETAPWSLSSRAQVQELKPLLRWRPGRDPGAQFRLFAGLAPTEPGILMFAGFTRADDEEDLRYLGITKRCMTNPIWLTTVKIGASATPVLRDGKAVVPPGEFVATFECDHSMFDEGTTVLLKQFNAAGDSTAATWTLEPASSPAEGFWQPQSRQVRGKPVEVDDCLLVAKNKEPIPLGEPWFPKPGVDTFAVILVNARDTHGNRLNPVAAKVEVGVPEGYPVPSPDPAGTGDGAADGNKPSTETGSSGAGTPTPGRGTVPERRPADTAYVCVRTGDKVELPNGATTGDRSIPAGSWTVPALPDDGLALVVTNLGQSLTVILTSAQVPEETWMEPAPQGFYGATPTRDGQTPKLSLKNHTTRTLDFPQPVLVAPGSCVFSAPEAEPGACELTVTAGPAKTTHTLDAVRVRIAWDRPDASVGETRELRFILDGASTPADWLVSGTVEVGNGSMEAVADAQRVSRQGSVLTVADLPGSTAWLARVKAEQAGQMEARARLRAWKKK